MLVHPAGQLSGLRSFVAEKVSGNVSGAHSNYNPPLTDERRQGMNPHTWLCEKEPGFGDLTDQERAAVMHFSLLWSLFEAKALATNASADRIYDLVLKWASGHRLEIAPFLQSLAHFRARYSNGPHAAELLHGLNLRHNDKPDLIEMVLRGEDASEPDCVAALLIIVYRLRNNLFHGLKWAYGMRGQLDNFNNANEALMAALDTHSDS